MAIDQVGIRPRPQQHNTTQVANQNKPPQTTTHPAAATTQVARAIQMADDVAGGAGAQFRQTRRRSDLEGRSSSIDPFERILEKDAEPKIEQLAVIAQSKELVPEELLAQSRKIFPDDSDLILVLRELIKRRRLKNEQTNVLEEVMQKVWDQTNEKHTKAGINIGFKAQLFGRQMSATPSHLRETYRYFLDSDTKELTQYEQWIKQYGHKNRRLVAEFIEASLVHDIDSMDPSCSALEFGVLLNHVVVFKKLRSSDQSFMTVFSGKKKSLGDLEPEVLACWMDCLQRPFKIKKQIEKDIAQLLSQLKLSPVLLQQKLIRAIKLLDADLFFMPEAKEILLEAMVGLNTTDAPIACYDTLPQENIARAIRRR